MLRKSDSWRRHIRSRINHEQDESPRVSRRSRRRLGVHDRSATRAGRPRLRGAERHDPARPGRLRHAGAAAGQHRHGAAAGPAVRRGGRSEQGQRRTTSTGARAATATGSGASSRSRRGARATRASAPAATSPARSWRPTTRSRSVPAGIRAYEDYREMLEKETDIQGIVNITPDHQHGEHQHRGAPRKGKAVIAHKPVASVLYEVRRTLQAARESSAPSHLLAYSNTPDRHTLAAWIKAGVIGNVREVHNWTNRPFWPQGMQEYHKSGPPVPAGFNWALWQGPEPDRPYHPSYTFAVYRGWYAYGAGCLGDMGFYSLWQPYRILKLGVPEFVEARPNNDAFVDASNVSERRPRLARGLPEGQHRALAASGHGRSPVGRHVLVRRRHEAADARGALRGRRGPGRRGHAVRRRQGQDPVRLQGDQAAAHPAEPPAGVRGIDRRAGLRRRRRPKTNG